MSNAEEILKALRESASIHYMDELSSEDTWLVVSLSGHAITLYNKKITSEIVAEFEIMVPPHYINLYTYSHLADDCGKLGVCLTYPRPSPGSLCKISLRKPLRYNLLSSTQEIESEINTFSFAVGYAESYLQSLGERLELPNVDVSMWSGVDLDFTDIDRLVERKYLAHMSWDDFAETIFDLDLPEEHREKLIQIIYACKNFEEVNTHLVIQEVIDPLLMLLEEVAERPAPKTFEVN